MKIFRLTHWTNDDDVIHGIKRQGKEDLRKSLMPAELSVGYISNK